MEAAPRIDNAKLEAIDIGFGSLFFDILSSNVNINMSRYISTIHFSSPAKSSAERQSRRQYSHKTKHTGSYPASAREVYFQEEEG